MLSNEHRPKDLTPSICEEVLNRFSESDDSLAGIINENHIEVRDFMILSLVCDQQAMSIAQLCSALGLSRLSVVDCVGRLIQAGLAEADIPSHPHTSTNRVIPTSSGRILARRILGD